MIRIEVQEYCSECCDFEPDVTRPVKMVGYTPFTDVTDVMGITQTDTIVRCKYAKRCENIKRYLERRSNENASVRP